MPLTKKKIAENISVGQIAVSIEGAQEEKKPLKSYSQAVAETVELIQRYSPKTKEENKETGKLLSKDDYWRRREERDLEKDKHIRLSGILQALLSSVNFGQYCTVANKETYLAEVEDTALRLAKFVTEKGV
jgi:hypothetical protein